MEAILKFDLKKKLVRDNDEFDLKCALNGKAFYMAMIEFSDYLRTQERHMDTPDSIDKIRERFYECLHDEGINLLSFER